MTEKKVLTFEEAEDWIRENGEELVQFEYYYKYMFSYKFLNHPSWYISYGGNHDDIYRHEVTTKPIKLKDVGITYLETDEFEVDFS
jgi:hypothetical protein